MRITIKTVGVVGWVPFLDDTKGDASNYFRPKFSENISTSAGFGSPSQSVTPEANTLVSLTLPLSRVYLTRALALDAIRKLRSLKGVRLHLQVIQDTVTQYYPNGTLKDMEANITGVSVDYVFSFVTQDVTNVQPIT